MKKRYLEYDGFALSERDRALLKIPKERALVATYYQDTRSVQGKLCGGLGIEKIKNGNGSEVEIRQEKSLHRLHMYTYTYPNGVCHLGGAAVLKTGSVARYMEGSNNFIETEKNAGFQFQIWTDFDTHGGSACCIAGRQGLHVVLRAGTVVSYSEKTNGGGCLFGDRLFYSLGQGVHFSDVGNHEDFSESAYGAGWIEFWDNRGSVGQIVPCDEGVVLFKDQSLILLKAKGAADDFSAVNIEYSGGKIVKGSAVRCGKYVMFLTVDGAVYRFDGGRAQCLSEGVLADYCKDGIGAVGNERYYFLGDGSRLLVMDVENGTSYQTIGLTVFGECDGEVIGSYLGKLYRFVENGNAAYARSRTFSVENHAFGNDKEKLIRKLVFYGKGSLKLTFGTGRDAINRQIELSERGSEVDIEKKGKLFTFSFTLGQNTVLEKMGAEISDLGGEV